MLSVHEMSVKKLAQVSTSFPAFSEQPLARTLIGNLLTGLLLLLNTNAGQLVAIIISLLRNIFEIYSNY